MVMSDKDRINVLSALVTRMRFAQGLGETYGGDRDLYEALGYKSELYYEDYYRHYKRSDIAKAIVDKLPKACWSNIPEVVENEGGDSEDTDFEREWKLLVKKHRVFKKCLRLDKLIGLGHYGIMLFGLSDSVDFKRPYGGKGELLYMQPYGDEHAQMLTYEQNTSDSRYGLPVQYQIDLSDEKGEGVITSSINAHYSRVLHVVEDPLENELYGTPRLQSVFNRVEDLQKLLGGSAEMFWRGARPGYVAKLEDDAVMDDTQAAALQDQFDEFDNNLRRWLRLGGVDVSPLSPQVVSPLEHIDAQVTAISMATGIPKRILIGSERGELASSQDEKVWNALVHERMVSFCEPEILRPMIDMFINYGVLPEPKNMNYSVVWPKMGVLGEKDKAEILLNRTKALAEYVKAPGLTELVQPEIYLKNEMDYTDDQVEKLVKLMGDMVLRDNEPVEVDDGRG